MFTYFHSNQKMKAAGFPSSFYAAQRRAPSLLDLLAAAIKRSVRNVPARSANGADGAYYWGL